VDHRYWRRRSCNDDQNMLDRKSELHRKLNLSICLSLSSSKLSPSPLDTAAARRSLANSGTKPRRVPRFIHPGGGYHPVTRRAEIPEILGTESSGGISVGGKRPKNASGARPVTSRIPPPENVHVRDRAASASRPRRGRRNVGADSRSSIKLHT